MGILAALLAYPSAAPAGYDAGQQAWDAGRPAEALEQWRSAAGAGDDRAMLALGRFYVQGLGAPQDFVEAHKWLNLAASRGNAEAASERDVLAARMTQQQVAIAQERASAWRPGPAPETAAPQPLREDVGPPPVRALREAQTLLTALGYAPGPADGVWGPRSVRAYQSFLRDAGLPPADNLTPDTLQRMRDLADVHGVGPSAIQAGPSPAAQPVAAPAPEPPPPANALHEIARAGDISRLSALLQAGVDVGARDDSGWTALMHAANEGHAEVVVTLLEADPARAGLDLHAPDGATALFIAAQQGHSGVIELLMEAGADASIPGPGDRTATDVAKATYGDAEAARRNGESLAVRALIRGIAVADAQEAVRTSARGTVFRDCGACPEMVVVPAGTFMMGSPAREEGRYDDEGPVRRVTIPAPFAVGRHEVTFTEWDACVAAGGCGGHVPDDDGWGRGDRPVIRVTWENAQTYVGWLSAETGQRYRLLSESEWEYAARGGSDTRYAWGNEVGRNRANCDGCGSRWDVESTAPAGSFLSNAFGLHDMHGNVSEWVEDCRNDSYAQAPSDGTAWEHGDCGSRGVRGGAWNYVPRALRSAVRYWHAIGYRDNYLGFRVARTLTP